MDTLDTLSFAGGEIDRAAWLRGDEAKLALLRSAPETRVILFWRGKPLVQEAEATTLVRLDPGSELVGRASGHCFLGFEAGAAVFAADLKGWEPEDVDFSTLGAFLDPSRQRHPDLPADHVFAELRAVMTRLGPNDAELAAMAKALFGWHDSHLFCARCGEPSQMVNAGWQRKCDACGGQHFPRTDPVVIMLITRGNNVLLGRSPGWPEGMYSLLAGFVEPGETVEAAVRREVFEETAIEVGEVTYLSSQPWPFPSSLMVGCSGVALSEKITLDPVELEDALWVTREDLVRAFAGNHTKIKPARKGAIAHHILWKWLAGHID